MAVRDHPPVHPPDCPPDPASTIGLFFCPECGHRSRFDGDWETVETERHTRRLCPDCGTEITTRPRTAEGVDARRR